MEASEIRRNMKQKFTDLINKKETKVNSALMTNDKYLELIKDVRRAKECQKKVPRDYWLLQHYDVLVKRDIEKLIVPIKQTDSEVIFYVMKDDLFDVLYDTHLAIGHGGRDRMVKELNRKYKNVTQGQIKSFLDNCEACQQKKKSEKKGEIVQSMNFEQLNSRCQVDLIGCQSHLDDLQARNLENMEPSNKRMHKRQLLNHRRKIMKRNRKNNENPSTSKSDISVTKAENTDDDNSRSESSSSLNETNERIVEPRQVKSSGVGVRRIVDIKYFFNELKAMKHNGFQCSFVDVTIKSETVLGLKSIFIFKCDVCGVENTVHTEKPDTIVNVNKSAVSAMITTGNGYSQLEKVCTVLNIPPMSEKTYLQHYDVISSHVIEDT